MTLAFDDLQESTGNNTIPVDALHFAGLWMGITQRIAGGVPELDEDNYNVSSLTDLATGNQYATVISPAAVGMQLQGCSGCALGSTSQGEYLIHDATTESNLFVFEWKSYSSSVVLIDTSLGFIQLGYGA